MVWVALVVLVAVYIGIWWAITRIPTKYTPLPPARHMQMQSPDRLRMDLHTDDDEMTL